MIELAALLSCVGVHLLSEDVYTRVRFDCTRHVAKWLQRGALLYLVACARAFRGAFLKLAPLR